MYVRLGKAPKMLFEKVIVHEVVLESLVELVYAIDAADVFEQVKPLLRAGVHIVIKPLYGQIIAFSQREVRIGQLYVFD